MSIRRFIRYLALCALLALFGCGTPTLSSSNLANQTMTYATALLVTGADYVPNGHDNVAFTFDPTGRAGTFIETDYTYGYATQADVDADVYANSVWYQNAGSKGEFTYNPGTYALTLSVTQIYTFKAGAVAMTNGYYAAASYEYQDIETAYGTDKADQSLSTNALFTIDSLVPVLSAGSAANTWQSTSSASFTTLLLGVLYSQASTTVTTTTITADAVSVTAATSTAETVAGTTLMTTSSDVTDYAVMKYFIIGQSDAADITFADAWKYGNDVSFQLNRTNHTYIEYEGDTAPSAPTVDTATGWVDSSGGTSGTDAWEYNIDTRVAAEIMEFSHQGSYIMDLDQSVSAARGIGALPR